MIAVLFGTFNAKHAANALLAEDLRRAGFEVQECHEALWEEARDKDDRYFSPLSLFWLALRWLRVMVRLSVRLRRSLPEAGVVVAGFNGQLDVLVARLVAGRRRVVFAPLVTITETLVDDRKRYRPGSLMARGLALLDWASLHAADLVVVDTRAHGEYLTRRFSLEPSRMLVQYLGAQDAFSPASPAAQAEGGGELRVLCYGSYLPLHGYELVARAICLIGEDEGISFELIGSGPERKSVDALICGFSHVLMEDWVPYEDLPQRIRQADVVLGIFGSSVKASMVIPNKIYQATQVGRPVVTADTPAVREIFEPQESIYLVSAEPSALADALRSLARQAQKRASVGDEARSAVLSAAGPRVRAQRLGEALRPADSELEGVS